MAKYGDQILLISDKTWQLFKQMNPALAFQVERAASASSKNFQIIDQKTAQWLHKAALKLEQKGSAAVERTAISPVGNRTGVSQATTVVSKGEKVDQAVAHPGKKSNKPKISKSPVTDHTQFSGHMTQDGKITTKFVGQKPGVDPANRRAYEIKRMEYIMQHQLSEPGSVMAGKGTDQAVKEAPRLVAQYGGKTNDWVKKSSTVWEEKDFARYETHYYENLMTGQKVNAKIKINTDKTVKEKWNERG